MIIDTVLIRDGEVIVKHDSGQETGLDAVLHDCYMLGHYEKMYTLCRRLAALAVQEQAHVTASRLDAARALIDLCRSLVPLAVEEHIHAGGSDDDN